MRFCKVLSSLSLLAVLSVPAWAQFPEQPIRFVTPYPPGGSHSLHAGIITTVAEPYFGQPMISVIRAGGGGAVAAAQIVQQPADGYTILFGDPTINSLRPQIEELGYTAEDYVAVARINYSPAVFVAGADAPFDDLDSMVAFARDNPNELIYSSDNVNGFTYVAFKMLEQATGTTMRGVEFGGGGPAMTQLLGNNTMAYAGAPSVVGEHIAGGTVKSICVTDYERWEALPDVPTCQELGVDIIWHFWRGALVHKDTPAEIVQFLSDGFEKLVVDEGFLRLIGRIDSRVDFLNAEDFGKLLARERTDLKAMYDALSQ